MTIVQQSGSVSVDTVIETYRGGGMSRREFFQALAFVTGSIAMAREIMLAEGFAAEWEAYNWPEPAAQPGQAPPTPKESITAGEKRLPPQVTSEWVQYPSGSFEIAAYVARPKSGTAFPALIVIHENRGLTEFVLDMAQRWAAEGLVALAPDLLSRLGGTASFATMQEANQAIGKLERPGVVEDLHATTKFLQSRKDARKEMIGVSGFCWGGGNTFNFTTESKDVAFAVPFYGSPPPPERAERIACPIYAVFAENDARINQNIPAFEAKMKELGKPFTFKIYPGTQHAFMNFTNPDRYNAEQAKVAWADVTAFVKKMT
jgi:carboxymethylenebutenolidase